ncbi:hypothetical protein M197_gp63 [Haloarcula hispanica tailed virus 2]|uniref:Uncharacterized protein n=1 Tax=Haloarcula hispanica tailed virus 2 TaxID=1273751 RepID=R4TM37_9CAUD|nr:hypothetical protein M197_gp63 [Haloarcula hispanica tailed virus 2]AGM11228.1 hypothetical protein HHTV2_63 [Haloarcula hispanica tailed virus 2]
MPIEPIGDIGIAGLTDSSVTTLTWETASDWDSAVDEAGVVHEAVANSDNDDASLLKQGYSKTSPYKAADLIAYYALDEDSGTTVYDFSGNAHDATNNGSTQGANGILNSTCYDHGGSGYVESDDQSPFGGLTAITVASWVNIGTISDDYIVASVGDLGLSDASWDIWIDNSGGTTGNSNTLSFDMKDSTQTNAKTEGSDNAVPEGTWALVGGTWGGGNNRVWVDAVDVSASLEGVSDMQDANFPMTVGTGSDHTRTIPDRQDEVWVWETEFSQSDWQTLYDRASTGYLETATKSFAASQTPDLTGLDYTLNGVSLSVDVIGSPGTGSEETVTQSLTGASSYTLSWSNSHTDFRLKINFDTGDVTTTATVNSISLSS